MDNADLSAASTIFRALAVGGSEHTRRLMVQGGAVRLLLIQALNHAEGPLSRQATADAQGGRRGKAPVATPLNTMALYEERTAARRQVLALELVVDIWDTFPIIFSSQEGLARAVIDALSKASRSNAFPLQVCAVTSLFHILEQDHMGLGAGKLSSLFLTSEKKSSALLFFISHTLVIPPSLLTLVLPYISTCLLYPLPASLRASLPPPLRPSFIP